MHYCVSGVDNVLVAETNPGVIAPVAGDQEGVVDLGFVRGAVAQEDIREFVGARELRVVVWKEK